MNTEALAGWYFRLNGFFTIRNFILHPARRGGQRTDVDIAGVRFPYRAEFPDGASADEPEFNRGDNKPYIVIAEVKTTRCGLNGPWTDPTKENMQAVLGALGAIPEEEIQEAAEALYREGAFDSADMYCALFSVGDVVNADLSQAYPKVPQRTWVEILEFVYERFFDVSSPESGPSILGRGWARIVAPRRNPDQGNLHFRGESRDWCQIASIL
jgi:hypothetical protein